MWFSVNGAQFFKRDDPRPSAMVPPDADRCDRCKTPLQHVLKVNTQKNIHACTATNPLASVSKDNGCCALCLHLCATGLPTGPTQPGPALSCISATQSPDRHVCQSGGELLPRTSSRASGAPYSAHGTCVQMLRWVFRHAMGAHREIRCADRLVRLCGIKSFKTEFLQLEVCALY